jgi:two-component system chemotaxis sensor kinase CheA
MVRLLEEIQHLEQQFGADAQEMMATFEQEALKLCDDTEDLILDMTRPAQPAEFNHLMRNLHTMKGITAQSGLKSLSHLIHTIEDNMVGFKERSDIDLNGASASFVSFLDNLRHFVQIVQNPADSEALISIGSTLEVSVKSLIRSLQDCQNGSKTKSAEANPNPETKDVQRALSYSLDTATFDHILKSLELALMKQYESKAPEALASIQILQEAVFNLIAARTSPGKTLANKLKRLVRDTADKLSKDIEFQINGFDERIDNNLLMALSECLGHMIKNSADHGLERPEVRVAQGKLSQGHLTLEHKKLGDRTLVTLRDDGGGIDPDRVAQIAIQKGLISTADAARMTTYEKQELIFKPGFSTKTEASEISGRGVGMDAVIHEVNRVGGKLTFESEKGLGTTFFMEFPAPYQLEVMAIFRYQDRTFALPTRFVRGIVLDPELIELEFGTARLKGDDETYTLLSLRDIDRNSSVENFRPLILLELAGAPCALMVDAYCAAQSIFVLPLSAAQDLPVYLRGAATDANWGAIYCIDCVELERNLNVYIPEPEDTNVKTFAPLQGHKASKEEILSALEGSRFLHRMAMLLEPLKDSPDIQDAVLSYIAMQVDEVKDTMDPIEDPDELHYLVAIAYTQFKTKWIQYNSKMNYMIEAGLEPTVLDIYKTSSLSHLLDLLEPLTHPDAVRAVTQTLGQTIRELHAA